MGLFHASKSHRFFQEKLQLANSFPECAQTPHCKPVTPALRCLRQLERWPANSATPARNYGHTNHTCSHPPVISAPRALRSPLACPSVRCPPPPLLHTNKSLTTLPRLPVEGMGATFIDAIIACQTLLRAYGDLQVYHRFTHTCPSSAGHVRAIQLPVHKASEQKTSQDFFVTDRTRALATPSCPLYLLHSSRHILLHHLLSRRPRPALATRSSPSVFHTLPDPFFPTTFASGHGGRNRRRVPHPLVITTRALLPPPSAPLSTPSSQPPSPLDTATTFASASALPPAVAATGRSPKMRAPAPGPARVARRAFGCNRRLRTPPVHPQPTCFSVFCVCTQNTVFYRVLCAWKTRPGEDGEMRKHCVFQGWCR